MNRQDFINAKRIVFKFGTNVLRGDDGYVSLPRIYSFIEDIAHLVKAGKEVIVITSGAVGLGKKRLGLEGTKGTALKQACAAIGQSKLMSIYENGFDTYNLVAAQILLTEDDFGIRTRYLSLRTTLNKLLELGTVPIINQNDTVSNVESAPRYEKMQVCFSDNDKLSALVASELDADLLVMTTEIYRNLINAQDEKTTAMMFQEFSGVIYDEFHYLKDPERGTVGDGRDDQLLVTRKGTGIDIGTAGTDKGSGGHIPPVVPAGIGTGPAHIGSHGIGRSTPRPTVATLHEGRIGKGNRGVSRGEREVVAVVGPLLVDGKLEQIGGT